MDNTVAKNRTSGGAKGFFLSVTRGVLVALSVSLGLILLFAVLLKFFDLSDMAIKIINQVIKILSVALGVMVSLKKDREKGVLRGLLVGVLYTVVSYLVFSLLMSSFVLSKTIIFDILFLGITGIIFGVIFVNVKK